MTRLVLVRHGQHDLAIEDGPLTSIGVRQAELLARHLRIDARGRRACRVRSCGPGRRSSASVSGYVVDDSLRGHRLRRVVHGRVDRGVPRRASPRTMARLTANPPTADRVIVCTHSDVIDATLRWARGLAPDQEWTIQGVVHNASMTELEVRPGRPTLVCRVGDVSYLPPELVTDI